MPRIATSSPSIHEKRTRNVSRDLGNWYCFLFVGKAEQVRFGVDCVQHDSRPSLQEWLWTERAGRGA